MNNKTIASTILEQLGGSKFIAMTGSKSFLTSGNDLQMKLAGNKSKANYFTITLNGLDLYDLKFEKLTVKDFNIARTTIKELNNVYAEDLQEIFTNTTGLYTHL